MATETETRLRAILDAIRVYYRSHGVDAGYMPAIRARATVIDAIDTCGRVVGDALWSLIAGEIAAEQRWADADDQLVACDGGCGRVMQPRRFVEWHDDSWCPECVAREAERIDSAEDVAIQNGQRPHRGWPT